jgi:hypothetical protein
LSERYREVQRQVRKRQGIPEIHVDRDMDRDIDPDYYDPPDYYRGRRERGGGILRGLGLVLLGGAAAAVSLFLMQGAALDSLLAYLPKREVATAASPAANAPSVPDNNFIARQAQQWGIAQCLGGIIDTSGFLTRNTDAFWKLSRGPTNPDREMFTATMVTRDRGTGVGGISGMFAAPAGTGACNTAYLSTLYFPEPCARTRESSFAVFNQKLDLGPIAEAFATADGRATLYLLPAGETGCVVVKSEAFY